MRRVGVQTPEDAGALAGLAVELNGVAFRGMMFYQREPGGPVTDRRALSRPHVFLSPCVIFV
jgi:D-serine deaminase-like pyridoxal phosphate-dependent protein